MPVEKRRVYLLSPREYSQEVIAVAFAKTSRAPGRFEDNADELSEEGAAKFHEKWVVGYGHGSVAEHAVLHLAIEGASRLAIDALESNRLASYTEKSSRYQVFGSEDYYTPKIVTESLFAKQFSDAHRELYAAYTAAILAVSKQVQEENPPRSGELAEKHDARIRGKYIDYCRYVLPASALANVGMTANARVVEGAVTKMMSHKLEEVRQIGRDIKTIAVLETPTLVKYAGRNDYLVDREVGLQRFVDQETPDQATWRFMKPNVSLVRFDVEGENMMLAGLLFERRSGSNFDQCLREVKEWEMDKKLELLNAAYGRMGQHDKPGREMELPFMLFDVLLDWGSYRDFWRNRMDTPIAQVLDGEYGIALPAMFARVGVEEQVKEAILGAHQLAEAMKPGFEENEHQYLYTNATMRRLLLNMDLRQLFEFWKLRGGPQANPGYRILALRMGELAEEVYPTLWQFAKKRAKADYPSSRDLSKEWYG